MLGAKMSKDKARNFRININAWVSEDNNEEILEKLWSFLESGMVWNLKNGSVKKLPNSCTRWGLVGHHVQLALFRRDNTVGKDLLKKIKAADPRFLDKAMMLKFQMPKLYPMKGGIALSVLTGFTDRRKAVLGHRTAGLVINTDGSLNFDGCGPFCYAKEDDDKIMTPTVGELI